MADISDTGGLNLGSFLDWIWDAVSVHIYGTTLCWIDQKVGRDRASWGVFLQTSVVFISHINTVCKELNKRKKRCWQQVKLSCIFFSFFKIVLGCTLQHVGPLFPDQGSNLCPALGAWSPNHWATRKPPKLQFSLSLLGDVSLSPEKTKCLALTSLLSLLSAVLSVLPGQLRALHWAVLGLELEEKY